MYRMYVTGEPGFNAGVDELKNCEEPPMELVNLAITAMTDSNAANVCSLVVKVAKNWDDEERAATFVKMKALFDIFQDNYLKPEIYQYACAVWITLGKGKARMITIVLSEILQGLSYHKDPRCVVYGTCLLSLMVKELPSINNFAMNDVLVFWDSAFDSVVFQVTRYLMHAAMAEDERKAVFHATHLKIEEKLKSEFPCVVSTTLGLMQNLMVDSPSHVAYFKTLKPFIEKMDVKGAAKTRKEVCLDMMKTSLVPAVTLTAAVIIALALLLQRGQFLQMKVFETTPLR